MKFLRAVRLDNSDERLFEDSGGVARDGEWLVSGGYATCNLGQGHRAAHCHCNTTFIEAASNRRCTLAEVAELDEATYEQLKQALALHLFENLGAPTLEAALAVAADEFSYTAELAEGFETNVWISVQREPAAEGVRERYSVFKRLMIGTHKL